MALATLSASRVASLATGRGGLPTADEWPLVGLALVAIAVLGTWLLATIGLTRVEAAAVAGLSPVLVLVDAPLGEIAPGMTLAANAAGCLVPIAVAAKILLEGRLPVLEAFVLVALGIVVAFLSSHVAPSRGVLLQYRIPALVVGVVAAALFHARPALAGAAAFAAGAVGVLVGADLLRLRELAATGGAGRVILGGAGLMDGIFLVALLGAAIGACMATIIRSVTTARAPAGAA